MKRTQREPSQPLWASMIASLAAWMLPVAAGLTALLWARSKAHPWPTYVTWILSLGAFTVGFILMEPAWRLLQWLLSRGRTMIARRPKSDRLIAADIISRVLTSTKVRPSEVMR